MWMYEYLEKKVTYAPKSYFYIVKIVFSTKQDVSSSMLV